jgi:hypothetical protein
MRNAVPEPPLGLLANASTAPRRSANTGLGLVGRCEQNTAYFLSRLAQTQTGAFKYFDDALMHLVAWNSSSQQLRSLPTQYHQPPHHHEPLPKLTAKMALNGMLVTFIVIVAAGFGVLMGFAITQYFFSSTPVRGFRNDVEGQQGQQDQAAYMVQVRTRNKEELFAKYPGHSPRPVMEDIDTDGESRF